ncbi:hypothetical protein [Thaumasiovibrio subtropicus]|uniref:hypothetical protein n=1 Tax=Thaumasiovibrio subtropicus TaxID=1891207 RepID=UPI001C848805|nr:hypothetical protein [Thaumasiovibrio subtropicus]
MTIYRRHKFIIELFGEKLKNKNICIKLQQGVCLGNFQYVPLEELAEKYDNIKVVYDTPLNKIISKSECIISDYFSSEFSNYNILRNYPVILFNDIIRLENAEIESDLSKFIALASSNDDISKLLNKEDLVQNLKQCREKNSRIIEYYSSSIQPNENRALVRSVINEVMKNG